MFVCNGKKRGPTNAPQLQSSSHLWLEDLLNVYQTCTTGCQGACSAIRIWFHQSQQLVFQERSARQWTRQKGIATIGGQVGLLQAGLSPMGSPYPGQSAQHRKRIDDSLPRTKAARHSVCAKRPLVLRRRRAKEWLGYWATELERMVNDGTSTSGEPPR